MARARAVRLAGEVATALVVVAGARAGAGVADGVTGVADGVTGAGAGDAGDGFRVTWPSGCGGGGSEETFGGSTEEVFGGLTGETFGGSTEEAFGGSTDETFGGSTEGVFGGLTDETFGGSVLGAGIGGIGAGTVSARGCGGAGTLAGKAGATTEGCGKGSKETDGAA
ncbi:MAG TPA: hypothetical protein VF927_00935 [Solirubrobacteraceae bacterium]